jgi:hypothetical protein
MIQTKLLRKFSFLLALAFLSIVSAFGQSLDGESFINCEDLDCRAIRKLRFDDKGKLFAAGLSHSVAGNVPLKFVGNWTRHETGISIEIPNNDRFMRGLAGRYYPVYRPSYSLLIPAQYAADSLAILQEIDTKFKQSDGYLTIVEFSLDSAKAKEIVTQFIIRKFSGSYGILVNEAGREYVSKGVIKYNRLPSAMPAKVIDKPSRKF